MEETINTMGRRCDEPNNKDGYDELWKRRSKACVAFCIYVLLSFGVPSYVY